MCARSGVHMQTNSRGSNSAEEHHYKFNAPDGVSVSCQMRKISNTPRKHEVALAVELRDGEGNLIGSATLHKEQLLANSKEDSVASFLRISGAQLSRVACALREICGALDRIEREAKKTT